MRIALINQSVVQNIIEADMAFAETLGYQQVIEATAGAAMHGGYANGVFTPPPAPPAPPAPAPVTDMTKLAFLLRFTQAERIAIAAAQASDPVIADAQMMLGLAQDIDVADPNTSQYIDYLGSKGYLTADRVTAILAPVAS